MAQHATVVYYERNNNNPNAFYLMDINKERLQKAFDEHDILMIKCITVELEQLALRGAKTHFTESDIKKFLDFWEIDY